MKETSFRTLMLMTTLLAVVVIFQATVRPARLRATAAPPVAGPQNRDQTPDPLASHRPIGDVPAPDGVAPYKQAPSAPAQENTHVPDTASGRFGSSLPAEADRVLTALATRPAKEQEGPSEPNEPNEPAPSVPE
ncbi:MAG: hypothetical protein MUC88_01930 [Planctomycetes bacterium]|jgi:hypothetical protein|nr:hypothetical protein [Planctomycetota bacterium]